MIYYFFAFGSRTNAIRFYESLNQERVNSQLINTPREAGLGCGLSVKVEELEQAKRVFASGRYSSFYGVYMHNKQTGLVNRISLYN